MRIQFKDQAVTRTGGQPRGITDQQTAVAANHQPLPRKRGERLLLQDGAEPIEERLLSLQLDVKCIM